MKFQSKINYVQECVAVLSNAAGGEYDLARELQTDTLPEDCRKDLELLSQIQREAIEGLSKENIEFYFKPLDNARTCVASLLGRFHAVHALDELEEEEAFFDTLTLSERLNARCEDTKAPIDEKLADFTDYMKSLQMEDGMRWQLLSALFHPQEHKKKMFDLLRHVRRNLASHEKELEDIFRRRREETEAYDRKNPIETVMAGESAYQLSGEIIPEEMTMLLYDPFSMRGLIDQQGQSWFIIGAFFPYHPVSTPRQKMKKEDVMAYGKILADGNKLEILRLLSHKEYINRELADALKLSTATISYHMSVLTELKLVNTTVSANKIIYSLNRQKMEDTMTRLEDYFDHLEQQ